MKIAKFACVHLGVYLGLILNCYYAQSLSLPSADEPPETPLPISSEQQKVPCDQIVDRLDKYRSMASKHHADLNSFLEAIIGLMREWYDLLIPLEGQTTSIEAGTFFPVQDGADKVEKITGLAYQNTALLDLELERLISSLRACKSIQ